MATVASLPGSYTRKSAARTLRVPVQQISAWQRSGLLEGPAGEKEAANADTPISREDLSSMRRLRDLRGARVPIRVIRRSLEAMRMRAGLLAPLEGSAPLPDRGRLLFRQGDVLLDPLTQQFAFDFEPPARRVTPLRTPCEQHAANAFAEAQTLFEQAVQMEERTDTASAAADLYREALVMWPNYPAASINLGTILYNGHRYAEAEACYRAAAEMDPDYALAFFDLGNVLDELQRLPEAIAAYTRALQIVPGYADAHYNLALAFERQGERRRALRHWLHYVRLDPVGPWATHARMQLKKTLATEKLSIVSRHGRLAG